MGAPVGLSAGTPGFTRACSRPPQPGHTLPPPTRPFLPHRTSPGAASVRRSQGQTLTSDFQ